MQVKPLLIAIALGLGGAAGNVAAVSETVPQSVDGQLPMWLVQFEEPAAAAFRGFQPGSGRPALAATSREVTGERRYDAKSQAARDYVAFLADVRRTRLADASERIGRQLRPVYTYEHALNGVALRLSVEEAAILSRMPGIRALSPERIEYPQTDRGPGWINADEIWAGTVPGVGVHRGEGQVVAVIDTGIRRTHLSFGASGITNPRGPGNYAGYCLDVPSACNDKIVGLYDFIANTTTGRADPVDTDGHGTHVAGTVAGRALTGGGTTYSGVAPYASIIAYRACDGGCPGSALVKSIDQAVADGVDVISYSIGGGPYDPWYYLGVGTVDSTEAFLAAREAGVIVAAAAGNDGPSPGTHGNPANAPWVLGVAAGTHDARNSGYNNQPDRLADFSGRGPVVPFGVVKPDVTAPGVNIVAASAQSDNGLAQASGTSMATPHVSGAAALLKSINPAWTADQIMSALMLTARNVVKTSTTVTATPHEQGAGMIDVAAAARAGLYLQVPAGSFRSARENPYTGGADQLNVPSLAHGACFRNCVLTRKFFRMPGAGTSSYAISVTGLPAGATVTPNITSFNASDAGTTVNFTVDVEDPRLFNSWVYGTVTLSNTSGDGRPHLRMPIAVYATPFQTEAGEASFGTQERTVASDRGFFDLDMPAMITLPDARFGASALVEPTVTTQNVLVDPTNDDPYDNVLTNYYRTFTVNVPAGKQAVVMAWTSAPSGDIDLFVGRDSNGNGRPNESEELCRSGTSGSSEHCSFTVTGTGSNITFWVMAQNWQGSGMSVKVETAAVVVDDPGTGAHLTATGPGHVPPATPFKVRLAWDDPTLVSGATRVGVFTLRPADGSPFIYSPIRLTATGAVTPVAYGLSPGTARTVSLAGGAAHERLYFDVPPGVTQMTLATTNGSGSVSLYAARIDQPAGPVVAVAPPRGSASHSATGAGANQSIVINNPAAGRWYVTPVNTGGTVAKVDVTATINTVGTVPALKRGSYFNPSRGGHGLFVYPSGPDLALLWYTYLQDGTPTWYYGQAPLPGANQVWSAPVYRAAWNGSSRTLTPIGNVVLTPRAAGQLALSYNIDGFTGAETLDTFLTGCPVVSGTPLNVSAHWFDAASPGYGYSVQVAANYEFLATFVYDGLGVPRFLTAEREGAFNAAGTSVPLYQRQGFAPLGTYATPSFTTVGSLTRTYGSATIQNIGTTATFANGVPGSWSRSAAVTILSSQAQGCD